MWFIDSMRATIFGKGFDNSAVLEKYWETIFPTLKIENQNKQISTKTILTLTGNDKNKWQIRIIGQQDRLDVLKIAIVPTSKKYSELKGLTDEDQIITDFIDLCRPSFTNDADSKKNRLAFGLQLKKEGKDRSENIKHIYNAIGLKDFPKDCSELMLRYNQRNNIEISGFKNLPINSLKTWSTIEECEVTINPTGQLQYLGEKNIQSIMFQLDLNTEPLESTFFNKEQCNQVFDKFKVEAKQIIIGIKQK